LYVTLIVTDLKKIKIMKFLKYSLLLAAFAILSVSCGNSGEKAKDKTDTTAAKPNPIATGMDSVTMIDKATGKVLAHTVMKRDSTVKPGDTVEIPVIDQNNGNVVGANLAIFKK